MLNFRILVYPQTKPHGHGDVHSLLYSSGLLDKWYFFYQIFHLMYVYNNSFAAYKFDSVLFLFFAISGLMLV